MKRTSTRESGQAAVESALTLPLMVFVMLGTLQLFMLMQGRIIAQYAAYQATRVGSITQGQCDAIKHAAILSLLPAIQNFLSPTAGYAGTPGQKMAAAFRQYAVTNDDTFGAGYKPHGTSFGTDAIVWIAREHPNFGGGWMGPLDNPLIAQQQFDVPLPNGVAVAPTHLELRLIFWCPLLIPFADWVFSRMALAQMGILAYTAGASPIQVDQKANWTAGASWLNGFTPGSVSIATELKNRVLGRRYAFPIMVDYSMRMMSPVNLADYPPVGPNQNCTYNNGQMPVVGI